MKHMRTAIAAILVLLPCAARAAVADYDTCTKLAQSDPGKAVKEAQGWAGHGGGAAALHCKALALVAENRLTQGGAAFLAAAAAMKDASAEDQASVYDQAGNVYLLAGKDKEAVTAFTSGLRLAPADTTLLVDRARAYQLQKKWKESGRDLDAALAENPNLVDALVLRAAAFMGLEVLTPALIDVNRALDLAPHNLQALLQRGLILEQQRDIANARKDYETVIEYAAQTGRRDDPSALAAKTYLTRIQATPK